LVEPQLGLSMCGVVAVAAEAVVGEDRPHVARVVDFPLGGWSLCGKVQHRQQRDPSKQCNTAHAHVSTQHRREENSH
jgi:hypothetical protein